MALFNQHFNAHDALEDVKALRRILFSSRLNLSSRDLLNHCKPISFNEAYDDNLYLCKRHKLSETFGSLFIRQQLWEINDQQMHGRKDRRQRLELCKLEKHLRQI
ncbi:Hypothetical predicted protein [Paramuricea clavata]|uniref:Uncharacterized protein n=1 Tax=Paramuricea clavata TaxID=317549 RepID=A0A6S7JNV2_PARCT|nr:Hypothetical predicted protein [Paramuricea clavata]